MIHIIEEVKVTRIYLVENCYNNLNKVYIGKEKSHQKRTRDYSHRRTYGDKIIFTYIDEIQGWSKNDYIPLESFWIEYFKFLGFEVLNKNKGGAGIEFASDEIKLKISKRMTGRKQSQEEKDKRSISKLGKPNPFSKQHLDNFIKSKSKSVVQLDLNDKSINNFISISEAARYIFKLYNNKYPLCNIINGISLCCNKKTTKAYKFKWKFK